MRNTFQQQPQQQEQNDDGYSAQMIGSVNEGYQNTTALQIRLNTEITIRQIEMYLRGFVTSLAEENGIVVEKTRKIGEPLANDVGIQNIMSFFEIIANPQVVQGNFKEVDYENYLVRTRKDLADELVINMDKYGIERTNISPIIAKIMRFVEAYMTRLIDNKERESYAATFKSTEQVGVPQKRGFGGFPFIGRR